MTSNTGSTGNTSAAGSVVGGGGGGTVSFPDRADFPFAEVPDPRAPGQKLAATARIRPDIGFPDRLWDADSSKWQVLADFARTPWEKPLDTALAAAKQGPWTGFLNQPRGRILLDTKATSAEIDALVSMASSARADALGEILSQHEVFGADFLGLLGTTPSSHPKTHAMIYVAGTIGQFVAMAYKRKEARARPSHLCPALRPPVGVPAHPSFPSGHALQAFLTARCLQACLDASVRFSPAEKEDMAAALMALARRIAVNREIAGLHYPSDTAGGECLAQATYDVMSGLGSFGSRVKAAGLEWEKGAASEDGTETEAVS